MLGRAAVKLAHHAFHLGNGHAGLLQIALDGERIFSAAVRQNDEHIGEQGQQGQDRMSRHFDN